VLCFESFGRMPISTLRWALLVSLSTQILWPSCLSYILTSRTTLLKLLFEQHRKQKYQALNSQPTAEFISDKSKSSHISHFVANTVLGSFLLLAQQPLVGQGLFTIEVSQQHSDTSYSVRLLRTGDQPHTEASPDYTQQSQKRERERESERERERERDIHAADGI